MSRPTIPGSLAERIAVDLRNLQQSRPEASEIFSSHIARIPDVTPSSDIVEYALYPTESGDTWSEAPLHPTATGDQKDSAGALPVPIRRLGNPKPLRRASSDCGSGDEYEASDSDDAIDSDDGKSIDGNDGLKNTHEYPCSPQDFDHPIGQWHLDTWSDSLYSSAYSSRPPTSVAEWRKMQFDMASHFPKSRKFDGSFDKSESSRPGILEVASPTSYKSARSVFSSYRTAPSTFTGIGIEHSPHDSSRKAKNGAESSHQVISKVTLDAQELAKLIVSKAYTLAGSGHRINTNYMLDTNWTPIVSSIVTYMDTLKGQRQPESLDTVSERIVVEIKRMMSTDEKYETDKIKRYVKWVIGVHVAAYRNNQIVRQPQVFSSDWLEHLRVRGILSDPEDELNWSSRGQHVEYAAGETSEIPLRTEKVLGHSGTALVESVMCRRIRLARKTVRCSRRLTREDAINEVEHLQRLAHSHIVRVVGTYTLKKDLAILLYPAAEWNLEQYMDEIVESKQSDERTSRCDCLSVAIGCLAQTVKFIHDKNVKHMDIKPANVLVRHLGSTIPKYKVYLADFGIARAYQTAAEADTESPTAFTRTYAAPEVVTQEKRGLSADIFSLGCVYMEMVATLASGNHATLNKRRGNHSNLNKRRELQSILFRNGSDRQQTSYEANISQVQHWFENCAAQAGSSLESVPDALLDMLPQMIDRSPQLRPQAWKVAACSWEIMVHTCHDGSEPFEAARRWDN
ncbi:uncharacterized protein N0V89_000425 [Didymosphaeria variabile]|uniref:Protein kinase domain-containing protein n=1 Tax=Didymosphaeria variabile TaxID=1932322 RepID=A0A9W9CFP3_9PLEO|nr:uncharacterized protein N0V89_000425 [Didymosphaeria variabile]KAJ4359869.1 hypothetical protein N0V89_000425 [Didymosphaeria variabile]